MESYKLLLICMKIRSIYLSQRHQVLADRKIWVCLVNFQEFLLIPSDRNTVKVWKENSNSSQDWKSSNQWLIPNFATKFVYNLQQVI